MTVSRINEYSPSIREFFIPSTTFYDYPLHEQEKFDIRFIGFRGILLRYLFPSKEELTKLNSTNRKIMNR